MAKKKQELTVEEKLAAALVREEEQPYEVPGNWVWTYLTKGYADCLDRYRKPINATERSNRNGEVPYYGATGQVGWIDDYLTDENLVLVGEDGAPFLDYLKEKAYIIDGKAWVNNHAHILKSFYGEIGNKYLMHYLNIFNFKEYVNGTTRLKLTQSSLNIIPIPLPPLAEQQRIVDRIESLFDQLDQAKALIQEALDSFETRKAAILHRAFTGELTKKWRVAKILDTPEGIYNNIICDRTAIGAVSKDVTQYLKDICLNEVVDKNNWLCLKAMVLCENITCGGTPTGYISEKGDIPFLKVYNIVNNQIDFNYRPQFIDNNTNLGKLKSSILKPRDIVMNIVGPPLRKIAFIPEDYPEWNMNQAIVRFRTVDYIEPKYFYYCLLYPNTLDSVIRNTKGVVGQANISITQSRNLIIPVPSRQEQKEIVRILDDLFAKEQAAKDLCDLIDQIDTIKKTILGKAFRGELGTNVVGEESAVELLKGLLIVV